MPKRPNLDWLRSLPFIFVDQTVLDFLIVNASRSDKLSKWFIYYKIQGSRFLLNRDAKKLHGKEDDLLSLLEAMDIGLPIYFN